MASFLKRLHEWATRDKVTRYDDPVLGEFIICDTGWECTVEGPDGPVVIEVGGRYEPDPAILETARSTAGRLEAFAAEVKAYLHEECEAFAKKVSEKERAA